MDMRAACLASGVGAQPTLMAMTFVLGDPQHKADLKTSHASHQEAVEAATGECGQSLVLNVVHLCLAPRGSRLRSEDLRPSQRRQQLSGIRTSS